MKALVQGSRVCQVENEPFPVAAPLAWIDCDDTVTTAHTYENGKFVPPAPPSAESSNQQIRAKLMSIDLRAIRAIMEGDQTRISQYVAEKEDIRKQLK